VPTAADAAPAEAEIAPIAPWYLNPFVLGGAVLVLLGGMVLAMRRSKPRPEAEPSRRISDDDDLRASMAKTRQAGERIRQETALGAATPMLSADPELDARIQAVAAKPHDLETHLSLLRLHHSRGNAVDYEHAAQAMRGEVGSTMDPRWREAVVMGASLMPGHALFGQAGWNSPRFNEVSAPAALAAADEVRVFEHPEEPELTDYPTGSLGEAGHDRELDFGNQAAVLDETFGDTARDIHRDEARMMDEDESSATRIELAKAYLDIGDLDGARSMLEDVLAEGGPTAKAEAGRLLKEIG
jgi:pilus assembly protein FimV